MLFNRRACCGGGFDPCNPCMQPGGSFGGSGGCCCGPIVEPTIEKCVKRDFCHEVKHL